MVVILRLGAEDVIGVDAAEALGRGRGVLRVMLTSVGSKNHAGESGGRTGDLHRLAARPGVMLEAKYFVFVEVQRDPFSTWENGVALSLGDVDGPALLRLDKGS